jgi:hypothetical protein
MFKGIYNKSVKSSNEHDGVSHFIFSKMVNDNPSGSWMSENIRSA